ncbi:MAG: hypothetical protein CMO80_21375 [Verrucomicrobiales bacterium]|nr:hypothetical protein [Verrucomicrobiales bacterium]
MVIPVFVYGIKIRRNWIFETRLHAPRELGVRPWGGVEPVLRKARSCEQKKPDRMTDRASE